jgi:hypothetical protein
MKSSRAPTHYDTLRVDPAATAEDLKTAYRRMAQKYHPDRHPGKDSAAAIMARINGAYEVLSDAGRRADYDSALAEIDERRARNRASVARMVPNLSRSSWVLLFGIATLTFTTLGFVTLYSIAPRHVVSPLRVASPPARVIEPAPLVPTPPIEPWKEPPPSSRPLDPETDPVARLVRDGVISTPPAPRSP